MNQFERLEDLYKHIETIKSYTHSSFEDLKNQFMYIRDLKKEDEEAEAQKAQWEIDFLLFHISNGVLKGFASWTDKDGNFIEIPSTNNFIEEQYEYLIQREKDTINPIIKTRYSHILWESKRKHADFGKSAVDGYLQLIKSFAGESEETLKVIQAIDAIKNAVVIASFLKYKLDEIKSSVINLINTYESDVVSTFVLKKQLMYVMLDNKKIFKKEDLTGMNLICESLANKLDNNDRLDMLELGEKVDIKLGNKNSSKWRLETAITYESMLDSRTDADANIITIGYCQEAILIYKSLKNYDKVESLTKRLGILKDTMQLSTVKGKIDITEIITECKKLADSISDNTSDYIIEYLIFNEHVLPKEENLDKKNKENAFLNVINTTLYDGKRNVAEHIETEEEHEHYNLLFNYGWAMKINHNHLIREIMIASIKKEKLSAEILIEYFKRKSWLGQTIEKGKKSYNWLYYIAPSLAEYFLQIEYSFVLKDYSPNFLLSMDSLTLKIEGLLRDICEINGGDTFYTKFDEKKRPITREKDINNLLHDDIVISKLDKNDLLFLKYVFIEKSGLNLRHKMSHCLMNSWDYSFDNMNLVLLALLRLAKFKLKIHTT